MASLFRIGQLEIGGESEFGAAASYMDYVQALEVDLSGLQAASIANESLRQNDTKLARIVGVKNGTMRTRHYLHGFSSSIPSAEPTITQGTQSGAVGWDHLMGIFARALGGISVGSYNGSDTVGATGSPTDTITVDDAGDGLSNFAVGEGIVWATGLTDKPYEIGYLTAKDESASPDEGTLLQTPDDDPQGTKVWGGYTVFKKTADPYKDVSDAPTSWTVRYTMDDGTIMTMRGCCPSQITLTITAGEVPSFTIDWNVSAWAETTGGTLTSQTWSYPVPEAVTQWLVRWGSGSDVVDYATGSVEITLGLTVQPIAGGYSDGGIEDYVTTMREPVVTFSTPRSYANEVTDFENQSGAPFQMQIGTQPGRMFGVCIPVARVMERPQPQDQDNLIYTTVQLYPCEYTGDTGTVADDSPIDTDMRLFWA